MGLRFRRSFKIAPGLRLNASLGGLSLSAGVRGAGVTIGPRGTTRHVGIPGTGLSWASQRGTPRRPEPGRSSSESSTYAAVSVSVVLEDDGSVRLLGPGGTPLSPAQVKQTRAQQGPAIAEMLERACERWNQGIDELLAIHHATSAPDAPRHFEEEAFVEAPPPLRRPRGPGLLGRIFKKRAAQILEGNRRAEGEHQAVLASWREREQAHRQLQAHRRWIVDEGRLTDPQAMHEYLVEVLSAVPWPRETLISAGIAREGPTVWLDVDLPEIEDMPRESATVASRGLKINIKPRPEAQRRKEYLTHVHSVAFRVIGETFSALPTAEWVVLSAYTQRVDAATGEERDVYVLSIRIGRDEWRRLRFDRLTELDPVESLGLFECQRQVRRGPELAPIEPFQPSQPGWELSFD